MREPGGELWERVARLLKSGDVSNVLVAGQVGVSHHYVARVRSDLGMPRYRWHAPPWTQARFDEMTRPVLGGHRTWLGRVSRDGVPMANRSLSAYRVAFQLHHDREPLGRVVGTCARKHCVAGRHQEDDMLRAAQPERLSLRGLDLQAIRTALRCDPPYPPLELPEARLAFRLADEPVCAGDLAERLGIAERTVERWKKNGAPSPW